MKAKKKRAEASSEEGAGAETAPRSKNGKADKGAKENVRSDTARDGAVASWEGQLAAVSAERDALQEKLRRAQAECANIPKRLNQQHAEALKLAGKDLAQSLLPILDNLDRTLGALNESKVEDPVAEGVKLIAEELKKILANHGIERIESVGRPFDPMFQEALMPDQETDLPEGTVTKEFQVGYRMHGKVLRPAKVAVAAARDGTSEDGDSVERGVAGNEKMKAKDPSVQ